MIGAAAGTFHGVKKWKQKRAEKRAKRQASVS